MLYRQSLVALLMLLALSGCASTREVMLAKANPNIEIKSVAQVADRGNSSAMNDNLNAALVGEGLVVKAALPAETRTSADADALISYVDLWRWDLKMYLQELSIRMFDARTGDLLATGTWRNSAFHGFQDSRLVVQGVVHEMMEKIRAASGSK